MTDPKRTPLSHYLLGGVVALLALSCSAQAVQTISTPNAAFLTYSLAAGASTLSYKPASSVGTHIMGTSTTVGYRGVGDVTLMSIPVSDPSGGFIQWVGRNSNSNGANSGKATNGWSAGALNTPIIFIDYIEKVWIEVGTTKDTIKVHNTDTVAHAGNLTWIW